MFSMTRFAGVKVLSKSYKFHKHEKRVKKQAKMAEQALEKRGDSSSNAGSVAPIRWVSNSVTDDRGKINAATVAEIELETVTPSNTAPSNTAVSRSSTPCRQPDSVVLDPEQGHEPLDAMQHFLSARGNKHATTTESTASTPRTEVPAQTVVPAQDSSTSSFKRRA